MTAPIVQLPSTTKRLRILQRIMEAVSSVQAGTTVQLANGAVYLYRSNVSLVIPTYVDATGMQDEEFPAVFVIPEDAVSFATDADGFSAEARWPITIYLTVKGDTGGTARDQVILEMMEELFQDVSVALLSDFNLGQSVDVELMIESYTPNPFVDPGYGQAAIQATVRYEHDFFK